MEEKRLIIYLNDHLAASVAAEELIERCRNENAGTPLAAFLDTVKSNIQSEQDVIKHIIQRFGGSESTLKKASAWLGEKVGRLKLNDELFHYSDLSRLEELEMLRVGIHGKIGFWSVLDAVKSRDARLQDIDFVTLMARGQQQHDQVETYRLEAARLAFIQPGEQTMGAS